MDAIKEMMFFTLLLLLTAKGTSINSLDCPGDTVVVDCSSWDFGYEVCPIGDGTEVIYFAIADALHANELCNHFPGNYLDYDGPNGDFGYTKNILWVDNGCQATFNVCLVSGCPGTEKLVNCSSWNNQYAECIVPGAGTVIYATVNHIYSDVDCSFIPLPANYPLGRYGYEYDTLWVNYGCKAEFNVCYTEPCIIQGDPHITSCDTKHYTYGGECTYYVVLNLISNFTIKGDFFRCRQHHPMSCLHSLIIEYAGYIIKLEREYKVYVNGVQVGALPYDSGDENVKIIYSLGGIKIELDNGVSIVWDGAKYARINFPFSFQGDIMGLCGTYDFNIPNDFMLLNGTVVDNVDIFGDSWEVKDTCP